MKHWLYREENLPKLWKAGFVVLALIVIGEVFIHLHAYFPIAEFFGFNAVYGFLSCVIMVVFAKGLGKFIKRKDDYYDV